VLREGQQTVRSFRSTATGHSTSRDAVLALSASDAGLLRELSRRRARLVDACLKRTLNGYLRSVVVAGSRWLRRCLRVVLRKERGRGLGAERVLDHGPRRRRSGVRRRWRDGGIRCKPKLGPLNARRSLTTAEPFWTAVVLIAASTWCVSFLAARR
jgi:hypothetical protein